MLSLSFQDSHSSQQFSLYSEGRQSNNTRVASNDPQAGEKVTVTFSGLVFKAATSQVPEPVGDHDITL